MKKKKQSLHTIWKIISLSLKLDKKHFFTLFFLSLMNVMVPIVGMLNTQEIVNNIQRKTIFTSIQFLFPLILFPIISILSELVSSGMNYLSLRYTDILDYRFSQLILKKVNKQNLSQFENPEFYDLLQRAEQAGGVYPNNIMNNIISLTVQLISSISYILILINWKWWTILIILLFPLLSSFQVSRISKEEYQLLYNRTIFERKSWYYAHLLNKDINIKETRLFGLENYFLEKFEGIRETFIKENKKMYRRRSLYTFFIQSISIISSSFVLLMLFFEASIGKILIGSLMTYINSISSIKSNFGTIIATFFKLEQNSLYAANIVAVLDYEDSEESTLPATEKISIHDIQTVELKNVSFRYRTSPNYVLKDINLSFSQGNNYVLAGRNGSGKTTLVKLLMGFYDNYEGCILINSIDLKKLDKEAYRKCLSAVFQDYTNFQFSVEDIIALSDIENKNDERILCASRNANADIFIDHLPNKYQQQVGNWFTGGKQLSGGEWQKLSIARAFYRENSSLVILDEPSSALDAISEKKIYESFSKLSANKIGIFITHRLRNFNFQGQIIMMEQGIILETGTQEELLKKNSLFCQLYTIQNTITSENTVRRKLT